MTVKAVKLISGEELVAEVLHEDENGEITVKNPLAIMIQRTQSNEFSIAFIPFAPYLGKHPTITFAANKIIFAVEVDDQMKNQYNSIFSGILTPPKQLIVG